MKKKQHKQGIKKSIANNKKSASKSKARKNSGTIRVGYIYEDFTNGHWVDFLTSFVAGADEVRYDVFIYDLASDVEEDNVFRKDSAGYRSMAALTSEERLKTISEDRLDILVDLSPVNMHSGIEEIFAQRPAKKQITFAENADSAIIDARIIGRGEAAAIGELGKQDIVLSAPRWCYTPLKAESRYHYRTPYLETGVMTIAVIGSLDSEDKMKKSTLLEALTKLMLRISTIRLVINTAIGEALDEDDLAVLEENGSEESLIIFAEEIPYETIDVALAIDSDLPELSRLAEVAVPVVSAAALDNSRQILDFFEALELPQLYPSTIAALAERVAMFSGPSDHDLEGYHQELRFAFKNSPLTDVAHYMMELELVYDRLRYKNSGFNSAEVLKQLKLAQGSRKWEQVIELGRQLAANDSLPKEDLLTIAWAYYFLEKQPRAALWAEKSEQAGAPLPLVQVYLQLFDALRGDNPVKLINLASKGYALIEQGEVAHADIKRQLAHAQSKGTYGLSGELSLSAMEALQEYTETFFEKINNYSAWLFCHNSEMVAPREVYEKSLGYDALFNEVKPFSHERRRRQDKKKLRIGYISADFRQHVMQYFCWPFLASFDRERFEVYAYSLGKSDQYSDFFKTLVTKWRDLSSLARNHEKIAQQIYADKVDIIFDLAGHTGGTGLPALAWKPAPIQISGLGYMATTGLSTVDYFVTDSYVDPVGVNEEYFTEKLLRLTSQFCYNSYTNLPESAGTPAKQRGYVQFASFNQYRKIKDEILAAWLEIMKQVPNSRLILKASDYGNPEVVMLIQERLRHIGFDLNCICFEPATSDYYYRYLDVDIALDTYPWPGGGTTADALYMGVPVISLYGTRHSTRFTYSMLANVGLPELASDNINDYISKAVALSSNWELLDNLHRTMRQRMKESPLMDQAGYIKEMEEKYLAIWDEYQAGLQT